MTAVFEGLQHDLPPLRGIVHAAGVATTTPLQSLDRATLKATLRPKVLGTWVLHQLSHDLNLDCFVMFSSIASVLGSRALAHYAAANHFLDALAHHRRALGLPSLSIEWGPWAEGGMASLENREALARVGMAALAPEDALDALEYLLGADVTQAAVAQVDWRVFLPIYEARSRRPVLELLVAQLNSAQLPTPAGKPELLQQLELAPARERAALLVARIQREVARVLGLESTSWVNPHQGFFDLGMDSLMAVELKKHLETCLGHTLPRTVAFDFPTINTLAAYLIDDVLRLGRSVEADSGAKQDRPEQRAMLSDIKQLSDVNVEASLIQELERLNY
jgi:acyl carrier protein